jgi:DNA-binding GntR family transcriptional regulator
VEFTLPSQLRLRSPSASDQLVTTLRQLILEGTLAPGSPLPEVQMAEAFGTSRTTIRDAVRELAHQGLVRLERHRTARVVEMTVEDAADIYRLRRALELGAADNVGALTADEIERVNGALERLRNAVNGGDWSQVVFADVEFHETIVSLHRSPRFLRCFQIIKSELAFCLAVIRMHEREDEQPERIVREHDDIRAAIVGGDVAEARALIAAHCSYYEERVTQALRAAGDRDGAPPADSSNGRGAARS